MIGARAAKFRGKRVRVEVLPRGRRTSRESSAGWRARSSGVGTNRHPLDEISDLRMKLFSLRGSERSRDLSTGRRHGQ